MKKQESIVKPSFSAPAIPGGKLIFIPYLPFPGLLNEIKSSAISILTLPCGQLFYLNNKAILYGLIGAPASISALEKVRLTGVKEIIGLSFCGSLSPLLPLCQAFIPDKALSDEGTSKHYINRKNKLYYPARTSIQNLKNYLRQQGLRALVGGQIVSTDAPYRETPLWLKKMQKKGTIAVDMEASAVLAFSEFYEIKAAGLFIVSDELFSGYWKRTDSKNLRKAIKKYFWPLIFSADND
jgi:purine-nucleoside phosphorylase